MTVKERYDGLQNLLKACGEEGCHFLTLLTIAEEESKKPIDLIEAIHIAKSKKWISNDFTVTVAGSLQLLKFYTGKEWSRREVKELPAVIKDNEYTEVKHHNENTGYDHYHRRNIDTYTNSYTVKYGYIEKIYIYTCEEI